MSVEKPRDEHYNQEAEARREMDEEYRRLVLMTPEDAQAEFDRTGQCPANFERYVELDLDNQMWRDNQRALRELSIEEANEAFERPDEWPPKEWMDQPGG